MQDITHRQDRNKLISDLRHDIEMGSDITRSVNDDSELGSEDWDSMECGLAEALVYLNRAMGRINDLIEQ